MTWSLAAVSLELPAMSFCFRPYLKKKPRDIGRPFPLVRLLILSMEMNSGIRRSIVLAASWSVRQSATACLRLTPSSPFISVRDPPPYRQTETKVEPQLFGPRPLKSRTHLLTRFPKMDYFGMGDFECVATCAPSRGPGSAWSRRTGARRGATILRFLRSQPNTDRSHLLLNKCERSVG